MVMLAPALLPLLASSALMSAGADEAAPPQAALLKAGPETAAAAPTLKQHPWLRLTPTPPAPDPLGGDPTGPVSNAPTPDWMPPAERDPNMQADAPDLPFIPGPFPENRGPERRFVENTDPLEAFNRVMYRINQPIDLLVLRPMAMAYKTVLPEPARDGARNALANAFMPPVAVNDLLQMHPRRALNTLLRFAINSTLGVGGLFDMAKRKPFKLPGHGNSFANTMLYYGMTNGPYLYLPLIGPTTPTTLLGIVADTFTEPQFVNYVSRTDVLTLRNKQKVAVENQSVTYSPIGIAVTVVGGLDARAQADAALKALKKSSVDPYAALRSSWMQNRMGEIAALKSRDGHGSVSQGLDDPLADPAAPAPAPAPEPAKP
jgi:phospholipid-binding lipoprotein MlaA